MSLQNIFYQSSIILIIFAGIPIFICLITGLIASIFQAATQIQEQTLTYVPKLISLCLTLYFLGPWMISKYITYFDEILENIGFL